MVAFDYPHASIVQPNHSVHTGSNTGLAEYALVAVYVDHLGRRISAHRIHRADIDAGSLLAWAAHTWHIDAQVVVSCDSKASKTGLKQTFVLRRTCKLADTAPSALRIVHK
jgi:hypothetical protein